MRAGHRDGDRSTLARLKGFSLHADVAMAARRRDQLEKLCRYIVRPPLAVARLTETRAMLLERFEEPTDARRGAMRRRRAIR